MTYSIRQLLLFIPIACLGMALAEYAGGHEAALTFVLIWLPGTIHTNRKSGALAAYAFSVLVGFLISLRIMLRPVIIASKLSDDADLVAFVSAICCGLVLGILLVVLVRLAFQIGSGHASSQQRGDDAHT